MFLNRSFEWSGTQDGIETLICNKGPLALTETFHENAQDMFGSGSIYLLTITK